MVIKLKLSLAERISQTKVGSFIAHYNILISLFQLNETGKKLLFRDKRLKVRLSDAAA